MTQTPPPPIRIGQGQRPGANLDPRLDWWRDARFGMFIHWGLYAIPAGRWHGELVPGIGEWIMFRKRIPVADYSPLANQFNPTEFDADAWARVAVAAGQKYMVITAKHHDGFCLFDSAHSEYTSVKGTPFGRDIVKELADACARHGLRFGFYYSQTQDWHHPGGDGNDWDYDDATRDFDGYVQNYVAPQVRELLTNYGPICLVWFDTPKRMTRAQSELLTHLVHELQPDCLVNGRVGNDMGDYAEAGDNVIPDAVADIDFETPATINHTWAFKTDDTDWKSSADMINKLVDIASKGGNYLLNVGPEASGIIPQPSIDALHGMGEWLRRFGESVYDTRRGPVQGLTGMFTTVAAHDAHRVYVHVFDWPADGIVRVPSGLGWARHATILGEDHGALAVDHDGEALIIHGPTNAPDAIDTVIVLTP